LYFFDLNFWQGFIGNLLATIIGVVIGIPIAFGINRRAEDIIEREKTEKVIMLLGLELYENYCNIVDVRNPRTNNETVIELATLGPILKDEAWNTFSDGGELQWVKRLAVIGAFAQVYGEIRTIKYLADKCFGYIDGRPKGINTDLTAKLRSSIDIAELLIYALLSNTDRADLIKRQKERYEKKQNADEDKEVNISNTQNGKKSGKQKMK
jgi:hypothetical protein